MSVAKHLHYLLVSPPRIHITSQNGNKNIGCVSRGERGHLDLMNCKLNDP